MRKLLFMLFLVAFAAWNSYGQETTYYAFAQSNGTYTEITGTDILGNPFDDQTAVVSLGFTHVGNGWSKDQIRVSANGWLYFPNTATASLSYTPISNSTTGIYLVVAPFGRDLQSIDATSLVSYSLAGVAPNRVFTVQWKNVKRYGSAYAGEILNFQAKIYETTSKIELIYGPCTAITGTNYPQVGLRGLTNTDFKNRTSTTGWNNTVAGTVNTETVTTDATYPPINGLTFAYTYTFLPPAAATIVSPANGETDVPRQTTLNWANGGSGGGPFAGYKLYLGTDNPPTNLVNGLDMGTATTYDPVPDLLATTTYYWRVDTYGLGGNTTGTVWSFTTLTPTIISGWVRNSALNPIIGASVYAGTYNTMTGAGGAYELELIPGTYDMIVTAPGYNSASATGIVVPPASNVTQNFTLTNPTMSITPNPFNVTVNPNELYTENMYILNEGTGQLDWSATIAFPPGDNAAGGIQPPLLSPGTGGDETTRAGFANDPQQNGNNSDAAGDILSSFVLPYPPIQLGWGLGVEGNDLWISSYYDKKLYKFSPSGSIITSFDYSSWAGANWVGDLAPGPAGYIYAVRVGTDNGIHKINTSTGADEGMITGAWATTSARGVAYDAVHNELWVGGWNHTQIYHVSSTGATISTISFSGVSGLGWHKAGNGGTGSLWVVTNASPSVVYELNPSTGAILQSYTVPGVSGYTGAGVDIDAQGNVWLINQTNQTVYKIDSGTPIVSWLTLEEYSGTVPPMTNYALPAHFNAAGLLAGTVKTATVTFTSSPDVGTWNIPVTMTVQGEELGTPQNLTATLVNQLTGEVSLTWDAVNPTGLLHYAINRDGVFLANTDYTYYTDMLPTYGIYSYTVQAVYSAGLGVPSNPAEVEWPNPTLTLDPASLTATVWSGTDEDVQLNIGNIGEGTLAFEFPDYTDDDAPLAYCSASASYCDEYISRVQFNTIDNSTGCSYYADYTSISTDVKAGDTYPITLTNPSPWSSDQAALWIDFNHNEVFDNDENFPLTQGGGGATFTGNILIKETSLPGPTRMRIRLSYASTPTPCGTQSYGEVEDYTVNVIQNFITQVIPAQGTVASGEEIDVVATFSATGSFTPAGTYTQSLLLITNDLAHPSVIIPCTMIVTIPGTISGTVTDCMTGEPIQGVMVAADPFTVMTDENGNYSLVCDEDTYDVVFSKVGYQSNTVTNVIVTSGATTTVNAQLCEMPYAPGCANAVVNATDTQCDVTWCVPMGPYELSYDDGTAENFAAWQLAGNLNAVKFTPAGYPATVVGGMFYVGDGSFPVGGNIIGTTFTVRVFDDDGATGLPGTQIGDSVIATVTAPGWLTVTGLNSTFTAGSFYLAMEQNEAEPNCAPIGVDETLPKAYKSYSKFVTSGGEWALSAYQDFMIHAIVDGPVADDDAVASTQVLVPAKASLAGVISQHVPYTVPGVEGKAIITSPEGYAPDAITNYILNRYEVTDPSIPVYGAVALLADDLTTTSYVDGGSVWTALPQGWYAYGVKAVYPNGQESPITYSNIVGHKMTADVTINVQLVCGFVPAVGAEVQMIGLDYPYQTFSATTPASGSVTFNVWKGNYTVDVRTSGYLPYVVNYNIIGPTPIDVILEDAKYAPRNLYVDANTLVATWDPPLLALVDENFEGATFPPSGWSEAGNATTGWFATTAGGSSYFPVPSHTKYAIVNDDNNDEDNCCTYLITPNLNLSAAPGFVLNFDSYFTGAWGGTATVELTVDGGATWTTIYTVPAAGSWGTKSIDLSAYSGPGGLTSAMIGFHYNDNGSWADGWAIDNVNVTVGMTPTYGYGVFLDGSLAGNTTELTWTYNPSAMLWGHTYVAGVAGLYCSGYSDMVTYTFTSNFLFPPRNLQGLANDNAAILTWEPPLSGDGMDHSGIKPDYSWMQSNGGTLSTTGNSGNAAPGDGFTAKTNRAETEIFYCGEKNDAIGTGGAVEFMCAARFTNDELYQYYGLKQITKVSMFCSNSGSWSNVTVKIWEGGSMGDPGTEVYSEDVTSQILTEDWTTVTLTTPVLLVAGNEYWIGYYMNATSGYPAGCDAGPAVDGKGDWMFYDGAWQEIGPAFGLDYNWCIKGIIDDAGAQPSQNLVSYVLYRDNAAIAEVDKTQLEYWDLNLNPATYCYGVTAKYDMTNYGFPGVFAESQPEGPACVDVFYGYNLPFIEDWTAGTFDLNQWTAGPNWIVDGQMGNPFPTAKFKWDPILTDYSSSLETWWLNGASITTTTPYKIWLDFDLALSDRTSSTEEKLTAEVWNGTAWKAVGEYVNNGSFDFTTQHIDITNKAKDKVFKVRFNANGTASNDIYYWLVDNVHIYPEYLLNPARELVATPAAETGTVINDNHLTWTEPEGGGTGPVHPPVWIHWDSGENNDAIGTGGATDFDVAARFDVSQIEEYDGMAVTKVTFFPNEAACEYSIRVWQGEMAATLVADQVVENPTIGAWNEVELETPVPIDVSQELWFGVRCNAQAGYPAGCDAGPGILDYGQWIYFDGAWSNLVDLNSSLDYNWNLQAYLESMDDSDAKPAPIALGSETRTSTGALAAAPNYTAPANATFVPAESNPTDAPMDLTGYNVYRREYVDPIPHTGYTTLGDWAKINTSLVTTTEYWDKNLPNNCYDYYVTAVYDEGESLPSNIDAWNCIVVGVNNPEASDVRVYPNPATTYVNIELTKDVKSIAVYNALGSVVMQKNITGESTVILHTTNYAAGAYNVKFVKADGETFSRKFVVVK